MSFMSCLCWMFYASFVYLFVKRLLSGEMAFKVNIFTIIIYSQLLFH